MKRILITPVGSKDPFAYNKEKDEYSDGPIVSIIRKVISEEKRITDVYLYFSAQLAVIENKNHAIEQALLYLDKDIKVHYFPKNILDTVGEAYEKYQEESNEKYEFAELKKKSYFPSNLKEDIYRFGTLYPEYKPMLDDIKNNLNNEKPKDIEILFNVSSGTPAMKSDLNLLAITNDELINTKITQITSPQGAMNLDETFLDYTQEQFNDLLPLIDEMSRKEESSKRVQTEDMVNLRKLLLLESIKDSFKKHDYSGSFDLITKNEDIIENKNIVDYVKHLYYRYIGDAKAKDLADRIKNGSEANELYPVHEQELKRIIEKYNVMKIKNERDEFNDWMLLITPIVEKILTILLQKNGLPLNAFSEEENKMRKISKTKIDNFFGKTKKLIDFITINDKYTLNAGTLTNIAIIWFEEQNPSLVPIIKEIDTTRDYRNDAAHELKFISKIEFQKNYGRDMNKHKFKYNSKDDRIEKIQNLISELIIQTNPSAVEKIKNHFSIYQTTEERIIKLLTDEINKKEV